MKVKKEHVPSSTCHKLTEKQERDDSINTNHNFSPSQTQVPATPLSGSDYVSQPYLPSTPKCPRLPNFSNDKMKGDVEYTQWRYHLKCVQQNPWIPEFEILNEIRLSVKRTALNQLICLGPDVKLQEILTKFDSWFGDIRILDNLEQQFASAKQGTD